MPPQLRSLFVIKEASDQCLCSPFAFTLSLVYRLSDPVGTSRTLPFIHNFPTSLIARAFRGNGPRSPAPRHTSDSPLLSFFYSSAVQITDYIHFYGYRPVQSFPIRISSTYSLPPTEKWWEDESCLSPSSLPGLFFCLIGVLLVTINSFLSQLQAALICCHRVKCTVPLPPHYKPQALMPHSFFLSFFFFLFLLSVSAPLLLVVIRSRNGFWGLFRFNSDFLLKGRELCEQFEDTNSR